MKHRLPQGRNLLEQLDLEGGGPRTATCPEPMEGELVVDEGGEVAIENHRHRLTYHLHEAYVVVFTSTFWNQYHRLTGRLLRKFSLPKFRLDQLHHHIPFRLRPPSSLSSILY